MICLQHMNDDHLIWAIYDLCLSDDCLAPCEIISNYFWKLIYLLQQLTSTRRIKIRNRIQLSVFYPAALVHLMTKLPCRGSARLFT